MCGSDAALRMVVVPLASTAAMIVFSVAVTLASSRRISAPWSFSALKSKTPLNRNFAPSFSRASTCVSTRRRPITSPPGGGSSRSPKRAIIGPAIRIEARIWRHRSGSRSEGVILFACNLQEEEFSITSISIPRLSRSFRIVCVSLILGMLCRMTGSSVRRQAAIIGNAAFLLPEGCIVPYSGLPPLITNLSIKPPIMQKD